MYFFHKGREIVYDEQAGQDVVLYNILYIVYIGYGIGYSIHGL